MCRKCDVTVNSQPSNHASADFVGVAIYAYKGPGESDLEV